MITSYIYWWHCMVLQWMIVLVPLLVRIGWISTVSKKTCHWCIAHEQQGCWGKVNASTWDEDFHHLRQQHAFLHSSLAETKHPGAKAVLVGSIISLERKLNNATLMFQQHIPAMSPLPHANVPELDTVSQDLVSPDLYTTLYNDDDDNDDNCDDGHF